MKIAYLFPGQGSQYVGMGNDFVNDSISKELFERAEERLGFDIKNLCLNGPDDQLRLTENTQPAILLISTIVCAVLNKKMGIKPNYAAGHSLGEYSAILSANAITFEDAISTVRDRGKFMQEATPLGTGAMAAIIGLPSSMVDEICNSVQKKKKMVWPANYNSPQQTVISGETDGVDEVIKISKEKGVKLAILLPVSAPFHTILMDNAKKKLTEVLNKIEFNNLDYPIITNVDAIEATSGQDLKNSLIRQVCSPVRWVESIQTLLNKGVDTFIELGPGSVLTKLVKKIDNTVVSLNVSDLKTLNKTIEKLNI